jgi:hypothetical protein
MVASNKSGNSRPTMAASNQSGTIISEKDQIDPSAAVKLQCRPRFGKKTHEKFKMSVGKTTEYPPAPAFHTIQAPRTKPTANIYNDGGSNMLGKEEAIETLDNKKSDQVYKNEKSDSLN